MLIPKKNRKLIYENLFKEGVLVAKKDFNLPQHPEIDAVPNLQVIKAMQVIKPILCASFITLAVCVCTKLGRPFTEVRGRVWVILSMCILSIHSVYSLTTTN